MLLWLWCVKPSTILTVNRNNRWCIEWFSLWFLMPLSTISQLYSRSQFYLQRNSEYTEKSLTYRKSQDNDKPDHIIVYRVRLSTSGIRNHNLSGDTHWLHIHVGSCKSNYHTITITTTMPPPPPRLWLQVYSSFYWYK